MRGFSWAAAVHDTTTGTLAATTFFDERLPPCVRATALHRLPTVCILPVLHIKSCRSPGKKMAGNRYAPNLSLFM